MENDPITLPSLTHGAEDPFRVVIFLILLFIWYRRLDLKAIVHNNLRPRLLLRDHDSPLHYHSCSGKWDGWGAFGKMI